MGRKSDRVKYSTRREHSIEIDSPEMIKTS